MQHPLLPFLGKWPQKLSIRQHDRALNEVTQLKNKARHAIRKAKRDGASGNVIQPLAADFLPLLRRHSWLCRESFSRLRHKEVLRMLGWNATATSGGLRRTVERVYGADISALHS